jgi:hypothetical protein
MYDLIGKHEVAIQYFDQNAKIKDARDERQKVIDRQLKPGIDKPYV